MFKLQRYITPQSIWYSTTRLVNRMVKHALNADEIIFTLFDLALVGTKTVLVHLPPLVCTMPSLLGDNPPEDSNLTEVVKRITYKY